ncbi:hypothetical protein YC2023_110740 [Brassica napus]
MDRPSDGMGPTGRESGRGWPISRGRKMTQKPLIYEDDDMLHLISLFRFANWCVIIPS